MGAPALSPDKVFTGTCAWSYDDWRDVFYPHAVPRNRWLEFYARHFAAVEMDSSFYHVPSARTVDHWSEMVDPGFRFCPKLPKTLSHEKRLEMPAPEINMMRHLADELGPRLGCALLQLPPSFHARQHEDRVLREFLRAWPAALPLAVEFRHESWDTAHAARILSDHGVAWVWADTLPLDEQKRAGIGFFPTTARRIYVRLLGDFRTKDVASGRAPHAYSHLLWPRDVALDHWASKLRRHGDADEIYVFANNHYEGMAVDTARRIAARCGVLRPGEPLGSTAQLELFERPPEG